MIPMRSNVYNGKHITTEVTVWYWPRADMILIHYYTEFHHRVWECDDSSFYWSEALDAIPEFILLGKL